MSQTIPSPGGFALGPEEWIVANPISVTGLQPALNDLAQQGYTIMTIHPRGQGYVICAQRLRITPAPGGSGP